MGASLRPSEMAQGGFAPHDVNVTWKNPHFSVFEYIKGDGTPVLNRDGDPAMAVTAEVILVGDDGQETLVRYAVGDPKRYVITADGKKLEGPEGKDVVIMQSSNFFELAKNLVSAGFPENRLGDDISVLEGLYAHHVAIDEPKRSGLQPAVAGEERRARQMSVPDRVLKLPWENKGKGGTGGAKAVAPKAKTASAETAGAGDAADATVAAVMALLAEKGTAKRQDIAAKAIRDKTPGVAAFIYKPEAKVVLAEAGVTLDGEFLSMAE